MRLIEASEHDIQTSFFDWVKLMRNTNEAFDMIAAIPNGAHLAHGFKSFHRLQSEGFSAGFPDVVCLVPSAGWHGLFLEFKRSDGKTSKEQDLWGKRLVKFGYCYRVVRTFEEAQSSCLEYFKHPGKVKC